MLRPTVYLLTPKNKRGQRWIDENLNLEPWQFSGKSVAIEHRYIHDILADIQEAGIIADFILSH